MNTSHLGMVGIPPTFMVNLGMVLVYAIVAHHHLNMKNHHQKPWDLVEDLHLGSLKNWEMGMRTMFFPFHSYSMGPRFANHGAGI